MSSIYIASGAIYYCYFCVAAGMHALLVFLAPIALQSLQPDLFLVGRTVRAIRASVQPSFGCA